jgi:hypothetical protein
MMFNSPDPAPSRVDNDLYALDKAWFFTREYLKIPPNTLFNAIAKSLQDVSFFKVWKVDNSERYIDLTTHSIRLNPGVNYHQVQAEVKVLEGRDPSSSILIIRIMPTLIGVISLYEAFTNVDVNEKFAKYVANLIFGTVEGGRAQDCA